MGSVDRSVDRIISVITSFASCFKLSSIGFSKNCPHPLFTMSVMGDMVGKWKVESRDSNFEEFLICRQVGWFLRKLMTTPAPVYHEYKLSPDRSTFTKITSTLDRDRVEVAPSTSSTSRTPMATPSPQELATFSSSERATSLTSRSPRARVSSSPLPRKETRDLADHKMSVLKVGIIFHD